MSNSSRNERFQQESRVHHAIGNKAMHFLPRSHLIPFPVPCILIANFDQSKPPLTLLTSRVLSHDVRTFRVDYERLAFLHDTNELGQV